MSENLRPIDDETYGIWLLLMKGNFKIPVQKRSKHQRSAIVKFYRHRDSLSLNTIGGRDKLLHDGKEVITTARFATLIKKEFNKSKGSGPEH